MSWWQRIYGYGKTLKQYLTSPKGEHDAKDYGKAILLIILTIIGSIVIISWLGGNCF